MAKLAPQGPFRAFDADGNPLSGGLLYTYEAGTTTPKVTYTDESGDTENLNPVELDADGYANVWLGDGSYKFVLADSADVVLWTVDDIVGDSSSGFASAVVDQATNLVITDGYANAFINATAAITLSLLAASSAGEGFYFTVKASGGNVTIDPDGGELIDGATTKVILQGASALIICNGTVWYSAFFPSALNLSGGSLILPQATVPAQTAEGSVVWDTDNDLLTVGDGAGRKTMVDTTQAQTITGDKTFSSGATGPGGIYLMEDTDNGTNTVRVVAPSAVASNKSQSLQDADGTISLIAQEIKIVRTVSSTSGSTSAVIPADNTIPQSGEGLEYFTVSVTPRSATNLLVIEVFIPMVDMSAANYWTGALFQDSTVNALTAASYSALATNSPLFYSLKYTMLAGTTSSTTFKFRYGPNATTAYIMRRAGGDYYGGVMQASFTVTEYPA